MSELFDDLSRIVGSGIQRRQMLKLIGIAFAGGTIPALWLTRAAAFQMQACNQTFHVTKGNLLPSNCPPDQDGRDAICSPYCAQFKTQLITSAAARCPTTCPPTPIVPDDSTCLAECDLDGALTCTESMTLRCHCDAPPNKSCCGLNNYCDKPAQVCCGVRCVTMGQRCSETSG
jgi:hypothetical protein